jgi:alkaline phosphatase D
MLLFVFGARGDNRPYLEYGAMIGHTGPHDTRIWARSSRAAKLSVRLSERADLANARTVHGPKLGEETDFAGHVLVSELQPAREYFYCVLLDGRPAMLPPYPSFHTAPRLGEKGGIRFAFTSCLGRDGFLAAPGWADMARTNIDFVLLLGDNHYADSTDPLKLRAAYYDHRRHWSWQQIARRTPVYAIWDDHDYGPNDSDGTTRGKEGSLRTFQEFWANAAYGEPDNAGIYHKFTRRNVDFFMLDVRYHRTPNRATNAVPRTMLGARQMAWLKRELLASQAPVKFVASGSEWQTDGHPDSWKSFLPERQEIFDHIRKNRISGVILISGDRHFTGGYQIQKRFLEITAGPLGARNFPTKTLPEMFLNQSEGKLYAVFDVDTSIAPPRVALEVYRAGDGLVERRAFTWDEIEGRTAIPPLPPSEEPPARRSLR